MPLRCFFEICILILSSSLLTCWLVQCEQFPFPCVFFYHDLLSHHTPIVMESVVWNLKPWNQIVFLYKLPILGIFTILQTSLYIVSYVFPSFTTICWCKHQMIKGWWQWLYSTLNLLIRKFRLFYIMLRESPQNNPLIGKI